MGKSGGSIEIGLVTDIGEYKANLDLGADAVTAFADKNVVAFKSMQSVSAAAFSRIGEDTRSMATTVSDQSVRAAVALTAFRKSQDEVRAASILVKKATGEELPTAMRFLAAAEENAAIRLRELTEAEEAASVGAASLSVNVNEAKGSLALMGDELGVKMNRHMRGFIADLPVVGSLLSSAFSVFAVVGLIEILDRVPEAIDKIVEKLSGWDAAAKKIYQENVQLNQQYVKFLDEIAVKQLHFSEIGLTGSRKTNEAIKDNQKEIDLYTARLAAAAKKEVELAQLVDGTHSETMRVSTGRGGTEKQQVQVANTAGMDEKEIAQAKQDWKDAKQAVEEYKVKIGELNQVKIPELKLGLGPEQVAEAEKNAEKLKQAESKIFDFQKKNLEAIQAASGQVDKQRQAGAQKDLELTIKNGELKQAEAQKEIEVNNLVLDGAAQHAKAEYEIKKESLDLALAHRSITAEQELVILKREEEQEYQIEKLKLQNLLTIAKGEAKEEQKIKNQLQALDDQHALRQIQNAKKVGEAQKKAAQESLQKWHSFFDQVNNNFKTSIDGWLQGTQTFAQAMEKLWQSITAAIIEQLLQVALKYIEYEILMKVFKIESEKAKAMVGIKSAAAQAGAQGTASMAGAPYPIDMTAPAFGTAMAGAASVYSAVGIAEKGALLDRDRPILGHAEELILPAGISRGLRSLIETGSPSKTNSRSVNQIHIHYSVSAMDATSFADTMHRHADILGNVIMRRLRKKGFAVA